MSEWKPGCCGPEKCIVLFVKRSKDEKVCIVVYLYVGGCIVIRPDEFSRLDVGKSVGKGEK